LNTASSWGVNDMAYSTIRTARENYRVALEERQPAGQRLWGVVQRRLIDELTQRPIATRITVETDKKGLVQGSTAGGFAGLAGVPQWVFSDPDLSSHAHTFTAIFRAEGYLAYEARISLGPVAGFPAVFAPLPTAMIEMHRSPIIIRGRVMRNGATPTPAAGLTVGIDALWRRLPSATASPPPDPYTAMAIRPGLRFARSATLTQLRRRDLIDVLGEDKALSADFTAGSRHIRCSNRINLSPGDVLAVDIGDPSITEYLPIAIIDGASTAEQAAVIELEYPLAYGHRRDAVLRRMSPQPPGAINAFGVDAGTGDITVLLDSTTDLAGARTVEISDGVHPNEYGRIFPYSTTTDSNGFFQLPPLHRVAQLDLQVSGTSLSFAIDGFVPDYGRRDNWLNVKV
jgi:hypothetical protein